jgi:nucleoside-diphosphate-sugar epimerase
VLPSDQLHAANLLQAPEVMRAVAGSEVVYLLVGLPYRAAVWREQWPVIMRNTIQACSAHGARLVFFDNVYMYDCDRIDHMDERTPIRPTSQKGAVRAQVAQMLMDAADAGQIEALIARSADFYGPGKQPSSVLTQTVFNRLAAGKAAQWLLSLDCRHSFTFTPDAARGVAMLGSEKDACGQVWHLPTAPNPPTGRQWVEAAAHALGVEPRVQRVSRLLLNVLGWVVPDLRELKEMAYQYDRDYEFVSDKFNRRFGFEPTAYQKGIDAIVSADYPSI